MAWSTIRPGSRLERAVLALVRPLRERLEEHGHTHASIAQITRYDRSTVSRALSGRVVPSREAITAIAGTLHCDMGQTLRRWEKVEAIRHKQRRVSRAQQVPPVRPADITSYGGLLEGLRHLMRRSGVSQNRLGAAGPSLSRSALGAALRGERSLRKDMVFAILHACQVNDPGEVRDWLVAWERLGLPEMLRRHKNRLHATGGV
ncbi:helix-turn-helix domain-containing protein [Streptosporangium roseum]|uniref:helix-turn-helix domain-containing protein n=1 Tax=Streptosporangium roseum TaxID=2001 RepID=UPI00332BF228